MSSREMFRYTWWSNITCVARRSFAMGVSCASRRFVRGSATSTVMKGSMYSCASFRPILSMRRETTVPVTVFSTAWCLFQSEAWSSATQRISPSLLGITGSAETYLVWSSGKRSGSLPVKSASKTGSRDCMSAVVMPSLMVLSACTRALRQSESRCMASFSLLVMKGRPCFAAIWLAMIWYSSCASTTCPQESAFVAFSYWLSHCERSSSFSGERAAMAALRRGGWRPRRPGGPAGAELGRRP
mmetsp:Transcript_88998/g.288240  ORF Transcript_88998/g.288240 Transcript_88998/m.288240 type:complete len:243 (+) Transcript_88998:333-1061(+)